MGRLDGAVRFPNMVGLDRGIEIGTHDLDPAPPGYARLRTRGSIVEASVDGEPYSQLGGFLDEGLDLYIDAQFGDPGFDGLSPTRALATLDQALRKTPIGLLTSARVRYWFAGLGASRDVPGFGANAIGVQTYDVSNFPVPCIGSYANAVSYRGAYMVPFAPATGPAQKVVASTTGLWKKVDTDAAEGRARTASVGSPGAGYTLWGTRLLVTGVAWTVDDLQGFYLRIKRGASKVIFEIPCAGNGANHVDIDFADQPDGVKLLDQILAADTVQVVRPSVKVRSDPGHAHLKSMTITGGGTYGTYDPDSGDWTNRGGSNGHTFERLEFGGAINFSGVFGYSMDRCLLTDGDTNFRGGGGQFVNCSCVGPTGGQSSSSGIQFQAQFSNLHDVAGCRADSAIDPTYQDVDAPMVEWLICKGALCTIGNGGGRSGGWGASYTMERNLSVYGSTQAAAIKLFASTFNIPSAASIRNRRLLLQGSGNAGVGIKAVVGSYVKVENNQNRLHGAGFDDVSLGTFTKTCLELQTFAHTSEGSASGHYVEPFSGSRYSNTEP